MTNTKQNQIIVLNAAREVSAAMAVALEAVRTTKQETWAEREQRLAEGHSSPSGWPIERVKKFDDGLTIPERRALVVHPREVESSRIKTWLEAMDQSVPLDAPSYFDGMPIWLQVVYAITPPALIILAICLA